MGKNVGFVRQQDHRRIVGDLGQCPVEVVHTGEAAPSRFASAVEKGELIAKAGEPELTAVVGEPYDVVLIDGHTWRSSARRPTTGPRRARWAARSSHQS